MTNQSDLQAELLALRQRVAVLERTLASSASFPSVPNQSCAADPRALPWDAQFLMQVIQGIRDPIFVKNAQQQIVLVNESFREFLGDDWPVGVDSYGEDGVLSLPAVAWLGDDHELLTKGGDRQDDVILTAQDGSLRYVSMHKTTVCPGESDRYVVGIIRDVTDRHRLERQITQTQQALEFRVIERTAELHETLLTLEQEIDDRQRIEMALRQSEERLRTVMSSVPIILYALDRRGVFTLSEGKGLEVLGLHPGEVVGQSVYELYAGAGAAVATIDHALGGETVCSMTTIGECYFENRCAPIYDDAGTITGVIGVAVNMTDRYAAEQQLQAQAQLFQSIWDSVDYGIFVLEVLGNGDDFRCDRYNRAMDRMSPIFFDFLQGKPLTEGLGDTADPLRHLYVRCFQLGITVSSEERFVNDQGETWWLLTATPLRDQLSYIHQLVVTVRTITDRKQAELALQRTHTFLKSVLNALPVCVCAKDAQDFRYSLWNAKAEEVLGLAAADVVGKTAHDLFAPDQAAQILQEDLALIRQPGQMMEIPEETLTVATGDRILHTRKTTILTEAGDPQYLLVITEDITDRKQAERDLRMFKYAVDSSSDAIALSDAQGHQFYQNAAFCELFDVETPAAFMEQGGIPAVFQDPSQAEQMIASIRAGHHWRSEVSQVSCQGRLFESLLRAGAIRDESGALIGLIGMITDISDRKAAESTITQISKAVESAGDAIALFDQAGQSTYHNPAFIELFGYTVEDLRGAGGVAVLYETPTKADQITSTIMAGHSCRGEVTMRSRDGRLMHIELRADAIKDQSDRMIGLVCAYTDNTDRKLSEQALRDSQQFIQSIADSSPNLIYIYDLLHQRHIYANREIHELLGYGAQPEQTMEATFSALLYPDDQPIVMAHLHDLRDLGDRDVSELEYRMRHANGEWHWLNSRDAVFKRDDEGNVIQVVGSVQDVTDRKQAEAALKDSEQRFRDVSAAAGEYIWELNAEGLYTFVTDQAQLVKGYSTRELLGHSPLDFMPQEDVTQVNQIVHQASVTKTAFRLEHRNRLPTGEIIWEEVSGVPMLDEDGTIRGFRGVGMSITDRKRAELQLRQQAQELEQALQDLQHTQSQLVQSEKMSSLGQLVAGVAHEINNPVNFIYGNLTHAREYTEDLMALVQLYQRHYPTPDAEIQEYCEDVDLDFLLEDLPKLLASMRVGAERIQKIVTSLRVFSRMDEAEFKAVDIHDGIDSTLMILQNRIKAKHDRPEITIVKHYGDIPPVECYAGQLNQVFMNILSNAIDALEDIWVGHTSPSQPTQAPACITIRTAIADEQVTIGIADNGPGLSEAVRQKLFDPFFTTKPVGKGTGMGLSISYQIITERHGGRLYCQSALGQGAEFTIQIPCRRA